MEQPQLPDFEALQFNCLVDITFKESAYGAFVLTKDGLALGTLFKQIILTHDHRSNIVAIGLTFDGKLFLSSNTIIDNDPQRLAGFSQGKILLSPQILLPNLAEKGCTLEITESNSMFQVWYPYELQSIDLGLEPLSFPRI